MVTAMAIWQQAERRGDSTWRASGGRMLSRPTQRRDNMPQRRWREGGSGAASYACAAYTATRRYGGQRRSPGRCCAVGAGLGQGGGGGQPATSRSPP